MDGRPNPESAAQLAQDLTDLKKVLVKLHKRDRDLLRMIYREERDRQEISKVTQTSGDHVRVMLHRAKRALRRYLDEARGECRILGLENMKKSSVSRNASAGRITV
jgi:DNA-directed RNA polymerase specialized sigma24 family protein